MVDGVLARVRDRSRMAETQVRVCLAVIQQKSASATDEQRISGKVEF
jgi:hypothetical protein